MLDETVTDNNIFLRVYSVYCLVISNVVECNKNTKPMLVKIIMCNKYGAVYN